MSFAIHNVEALEFMRGMGDNSVDAVITDPPYFRVKGEAWDRQWESSDKFIAWIGILSEQWERILRPNGSLYVFASPKMAARVEVEIGRRFNVLNRIRWIKEAGWHNKAEKRSLRSFLSPWEEVIFAEHYGADNIAKGEAGYVAKCDELRGFVFEPLRRYLDDERNRAGVSKEDINEALGFRRLGGMAGRHYFSQSQWQLPTAEHYRIMRDALSNLNHGGQYLRREYEDLRREYEDLRREYEDLRRPFSVSADVPYTDVWTFKTVQAYRGKHVCEKPLDMMRHIVKSSTREGATVFDPFMGSGSTGVACVQLGRSFIGCDLSAHWVDVAGRRMAEVESPTQMELVA